MLDRIVSVITYYTLGIFGLIWMIFSVLTKKRISPFLSFNIYQSIFLGAMLSIFSLLYGIALNIIIVIPFVGKLMKTLDIFLNQAPIYLSFTPTGLLLTIFLTYLALTALLGRKSYIPVVSDIITTNFGG